MLPMGTRKCCTGHPKTRLRCLEGHKAAPVAFTPPSVMGTLRAWPQAPVPVGFGILQRSPLLSVSPQMQLAAGRGAEPGGRLLTPLALLLAAAGLCLSLYSARRMADPAKAPPEP